MKFLHPRSALRFVTGVLAFVPFLVQVRAGGDDSSSDDCQNIQHLICDTNAFHSFCDALDYVGLDGILVADEDHYTAFVPHNNAFQDLLYHCDVDYIDDFPVNTLKDLLLYHIHEGEIFDKDDLQDRCGDLLLMKNDENTRTTCSYSRNKIFQKGGGNPPDNKPRIISFDIDACNGIVHAVNRVILPSGFQCPTHPTHHPSKKPTRKPTHKPSPSPTHPHATKKPTRQPTKKPTRQPTKKPTPRPNGEFDDAACSANPACDALNLTGDCCPTSSDEILDCCYGHDTTHNPTRKPTRKPTPNPTKSPTNPTRKPTPRPTKSPTNPTRKPTPRPTGHFNEAACSAHPDCDALGLTGDCCTTGDGTRLDCCSHVHGRDDSCSANPRCNELGLLGDCCPTDNGSKLDCCYDNNKPRQCALNQGCAAMGLLDDCCPTKQDVHLDCCDKDAHQFRIIDAEYCQDTPEFGCYKFGRPECCLKSSINCPKEKPGCEVGFPIIGESYCTYPPKYGCYENGWPKCCDTLSEDCPENRPNCELGKLFNTESYCGESADFRCHEKGYPSCCLTKNANCPNNVPGCNIGKVGCGEGDSLRSISDFACSLENFDILCYLIEGSDIEQLLQDEGTYTLFAPSNAAFRDLGDEALAGLIDKTGDWQDILKYHISDEIYLESELYCGREIDTLLRDNGDNFFATTTTCEYGSLYQKGSGNNENSYPKISYTDIVTCNGVVHVVDKVILPNN